MEPGDGSDMTSGIMHYPDHNHSELEALASFWRAPSLVRARSSAINHQNTLWPSKNTNVAVRQARKRQHTEVERSVGTPYPTATRKGVHVRAWMDHSWLDMLLVPGTGIWVVRTDPAGTTGAVDGAR